MDIQSQPHLYRSLDRWRCGTCAKKLKPVLCQGHNNPLDAGRFFVIVSANCLRSQKVYSRLLFSAEITSTDVCSFAGRVLGCNSATPVSRPSLSAHTPPKTTQTRTHSGASTAALTYKTTLSIQRTQTRWPVGEVQVVKGEEAEEVVEEVAAVVGGEVEEVEEEEGLRGLEPWSRRRWSQVEELPRRRCRVKLCR